MQKGWKWSKNKISAINYVVQLKYMCVRYFWTLVRIFNISYFLGEYFYICHILLTLILFMFTIKVVLQFLYILYMY